MLNFTVPDVLTALSLVANVAMGVLLFLASKRSDRKIEGVRHELGLEMERRKQQYAMKTGQYQAYWKLIDDFGKTYQVDIIHRMNAILAEFFKSIREAGELTKDSMDRFSAHVMEIVADSNRDYATIKSETSQLRLVASDEVCAALDEVESMMGEATNDTNTFLRSLTKLVLSGDQESIAKHVEQAKRKGVEMQERKDALLQRMRLELHQI